jgi:hypothetical protein
MSEKMPLLFNRAEAAEFLHLETEATLGWIEKTFQLPSHSVGRQKVYWKRDLEAVAYKIVGEDVPVDLRRKKCLNLSRESA